MRVINTLSYKLAHSLSAELNHTHEKKRVYYYGFQIVIGGLVKGILLVLLAFLLGILHSTLSVLFFFAALRIVAGGYHMDNYNRCMFTSFGIFILLGLMVEHTYIYWNFTLLVALSVSAFAAALISSVKWAPADTPYKPITDPKKRKNLKILSIIVVFAWLAADIILIINKLNFYVLAGCSGMLMAAFIISPAGYRFFDFISGKKRKSENPTLSA
ncbi:MAG: accessory regulator AgrB [Ruminiclostridium sp.]|nr:accessory regulator AgrB [Ruminiclostridium sp.]